LKLFFVQVRVNALSHLVYNYNDHHVYTHTHSASTLGYVSTSGQESFQSINGKKK